MAQKLVSKSFRTPKGTPLYRCDKGERGCYIEGYEGNVVIAGARRRRRR